MNRSKIHLILIICCFVIGIVLISSCAENTSHLSPNSKNLMISNSSPESPAVQGYDIVSSSHPNTSTIWPDNVSALNTLHPFEDALNVSEQAIELNRSDVDAWIEKGYSLNVLTRYQEAENASVIAIELDPLRADAWMNLGYSYDELDDDKKASKAYDSAIRLNNAGVHIRSENHEILQSLNTTRAITWRNIGIVFSPRNPAKKVESVLKRMNSLEESLLFVADYNKNPRCLIINLDMSEEEMNTLSQDANIRELVLQKIKSSSISLEDLYLLEFRLHDIIDPRMVTKVAYKGETLQQKIRGVQNSDQNKKAGEKSV